MYRCRNCCAAYLELPKTCHCCGWKVFENTETFSDEEQPSSTIFIQCWNCAKDIEKSDQVCSNCNAPQKRDKFASSDNSPACMDSYEPVPKEKSS